MDWLSMIPPQGWAVIALGAGVLAALAFVIGRRTSAQVAQIKELAGALESARVETTEAQEALDSYRGRVTSHFTETSEKLHDLTLHYRTVYDHLAKGASELCPDGFEQLDGGLGIDSLPLVLETDTGIDPQPAAALDAEDQLAEVEREAEAPEAEQQAGAEEPETPEALDEDSSGEPIGGTPKDVRPLP
jgi:uncharacterized membrane-anchored protein YhcB (DUF1043 family)